MHTLNSNALLEDLLFRCYHIYNINLTKGMKEAASLRVPLEIDIKQGNNWLEAH